MILSNDCFYSYTATTTRWHSLFKEEKYRLIILDCLNEYREKKGLLLFGLVIMLSHVHLIAASGPENDFLDIIQAFEKRTSCEITNQLRKDNEILLFSLYKRMSGSNLSTIWQKNGLPVTIKSEKYFIEQLEHIHANPVRKGYVLKPEDWKYSSARNWLLGDHSIISLDMERLLP